jgi:hypothetical protein
VLSDQAVVQQVAGFTGLGKSPNIMPRSPTESLRTRFCPLCQTTRPSLRRFCPTSRSCQMPKPCGIISLSVALKLVLSKHFTD